LHDGVPGTLQVDLISKWTVGAAWPVTERQFVAIQQRFKNDMKKPPTWKATYGCADWAIDVLQPDGKINYKPGKFTIRDTDPDLARLPAQLRQLVLERIFPQGVRQFDAYLPGKLGKEIRAREPQGSIRLELVRGN
jgi:hypothetical protein